MASEAGDIIYRYPGSGVRRQRIRAINQGDGTYVIVWMHPFTRSEVRTQAVENEADTKARMDAIVAFLDYAMAAFGVFGQLAGGVQAGGDVPTQQSTADALAALVGNVPEFPSGVIGE